MSSFAAANSASVYPRIESEIKGLGKGQRQRGKGKGKGITQGGEFRTFRFA